MTPKTAANGTGSTKIRRRTRVLLILASMMSIVFALDPPPSLGQEKAPRGETTLAVGVKEAPPFAMKTADGRWMGISVELWHHIADELDLEYELRELPLKEMLDGVAEGNLAVALGALTITPERENRLDFTHAFYTTGLGIAVSYESEDPWLAVLKRFISSAFLKAVAALSVLLLAVGVAIWWLEKRRNSEQFHPSPIKGIGDGFWWSAVTMTTVGYGDKAPLTFGGRLLGLFWMFAGIIMISGFTAAIASALTVTQLDSLVKGPEDLAMVRVGTVPESTSELYLEGSRTAFKPCDTVRAGLNDLSEGELDAFVYDAPLLLYLINVHFRGRLQVLPGTFQRQDYGIALCEASPLREPVNRVLLNALNKPLWDDIVTRHLGSAAQH